jgi:hypothetical protein
MATPPRPTSQRDVFAESDSPSRGFLGLLSLVLFQPRQFFKQLSFARHGLTVALLILALIAYSAVQQASPPSTTPIDSGGMPPTEGEFPPMDGGGVPLDTGVSTSPVADPTEAWMTGLTAAGAQAIYWGVLAIVLSEVSLFNGQSPVFGRNLQIAVWASVPLALMAGVQILFIMGGGTIGEGGFAGFLDEWEAFSTMNIYVQSALYALAMQLNLFWLWSLVLVYIGAREALKGKRFAVLLVLVMWIAMLTFAFGFQSYQRLVALQTDSGMNGMPMDGEFMPEGEFPIDGDISSEGEFPLEGEFSSEGEVPLEGEFSSEGESSSDSEAAIETAPVRSGGKP